MFPKRIKSLIGGGLSALLLTVAGCTIPGSVSGGGWIPSADHVTGDKANFGMAASQCDLNQPPTGNFNYHDKTASFSTGVKLAGPIADAGQCVSLPCNTDADCTAEDNGVCSGSPGLCLYPLQGTVTSGCALCAQAAILGIPLPSKTYGFDVNYTSTNKYFPGSGAASVCVVDNGQGSKASSKDFAMISVSSGPYTGYSNAGFVQGNVSAQTCP